jgi:polysaccharide export outer membrane protein
MNMNRSSLISIAAYLVIGLHGAERDSKYVVGPEDSISVRVADVEEFAPNVLGALRVDGDGNVALPLVGRFRASGLTVDELERAITNQLSRIMNAPEVTVAVLETHSHPVSVIGAVGSPGVYQVANRKTLEEVIALAGGITNDAGDLIRVTRKSAEGKLPLPTAVTDSSGQFSIGEVSAHELLQAKNPQLNIEIKAADTITVPKAEIVYVIGAVKRAGGFPLRAREEVSILQALSLAEGVDRLAAIKDARILHQAQHGVLHEEERVNLKRILAGVDPDRALHANDILFVPSSTAKTVTYRALEAAIQTGTGVIIWNR